MEIFDSGEPVDRILSALAAEESSLTGPQLERATRLTLAQISDAVSLLEFSDFVRCTYFETSTPYEFSSVELTEPTRLQMGGSSQLSHSRQLSILSKELQGLWSRPESIQRFAKMLRGSTLPPSDLNQLLDALPPAGAGTTGSAVSSIHDIIDRVRSERSHRTPSPSAARPSPQPLGGESVSEGMSKNPESFDTAFETYEVDRILGEGGAGRVFAVRDSADTPLALKLMRPEGVTSDRRRRFRNEIAFCSQSTHPNIVRVVDSGYVALSNAKCPFYVMPRFERTLRDEIGSIRPSDVLPLFSFILDGVEAAHLVGVWHRDLKPENVLLDKNPVIADFGIAHFSDSLLETAVKTKDTSRLANFVYAAPEQRQKGGPVDHRADIYALGLMLNELYTRAVPHGTDFTRIAESVPDYAYLDDLVDQMLRQDPAARIQSIALVKSTMIAFGNQFIAQQELREAEQRVAPVYEPDEVQPVELVGVDVRDGQLHLQLNRAPEQDWVSAFHRPDSGYSAVYGKGPEAFSFSGDKAAISVTAHDAQSLIDNFKKYLVMATRQCQNMRVAKAKEAERREAARLQGEQRKAEERRRLLRNLKI